ncbi:nucleotidyltransferase family protein [soil metagenome]
MSTLERITKTLTELKPELMEKYHVSSIGLFGSIVRTDFSSTSDIDIIVDFDQPVGIEFIDLANYIELRLQNPVDLVSKKGIKPAYLFQIEKDIGYV